MYQGGGHNFAVALGLLDGDHALGATPVAGVFGDAGALAVAVFGGGEHALLLILGDQHGNHALAIFQVHAFDAARLAAMGGHFVLVKTYRFATVGKQHDVVLAVGDGRADQVVALVQVDRNNADLARVVEVVQWSLLDDAHGRGHEHKLVCRKSALVTSQWQHHGDFFAFLQWEHIDDGAPAGAARALRHFPHLEPVQTAAVGEAQDVVVCVGYKELVHPVVFFGRRGLLAASAALLRPVFA